MDGGFHRPESAEAEVPEAIDRPMAVLGGMRGWSLRGRFASRPLLASWLKERVAGKGIFGLRSIRQRTGWSSTCTGESLHGFPSGKTHPINGVGPASLAYSEQRTHPP